MNQTQRPYLIGMISICLFWSSAAALAADGNPSSPQTTVDPSVPVDQLRVMLEPLTADELATEAGAWFDLYRAKIHQMAEVELARLRGPASTAADQTAATTQPTTAQAEAGSGRAAGRGGGNRSA